MAWYKTGKESSLSFLRIYIIYDICYVYLIGCRGGVEISKDRADFNASQGVINPIFLAHELVLLSNFLILDIFLNLLI